MPRLPHYRYILLGIYTVAGVIFIIAPLAIVVLTSFSAVAYNVFPPEAYSLRWYENLIDQHSFYKAALKSVILATLATAIAMVVGTMAAYALVRYSFRAASLMKAFMLSPIVLPKIVLGVAVFMFFIRIGVYGNYSSLLLTHVLVVLPFVIAVVSAALLNFDWSLEEAAMDLGAGPLRTFLRVTMPQISVSMIVSAIFAWVTSFDQVETTLFLVRAGDNTLPIEMFLYLQKWQDPTIAALSTVLIAFAFVIVAGLSLVLRGPRNALEVMQSKEPST
jgi:putative spermidine/putrescine transport system permease protein